jgi:hypothetical protein
MIEPSINSGIPESEKTIKKLKRIVAGLASLGVVGMAAYLVRPFIGAGTRVDRGAIGNYPLWLLVWLFIFIPVIVKKRKPIYTQKRQLIITIVCLAVVLALIAVIIWSIW